MLKGTELVEIIAEANGITKKEAKIELDRVIEGIATTIPFHKRVLDNEVFLAGDATTDFIETQMGDVL